MNIYIANFRKKYGSFALARPKTVFDPTILNDYISRMIAGVDSIHSNDDMKPNEEEIPKEEVHGDKDIVMFDSIDIGNECIVLNSDDENENEDTVIELKRESFCMDKTLVICLDRIKDPDNPERKIVDEDIKPPVMKRVRFSDELGQNIAEVKYFTVEENSDDADESSDNEDSSSESIEVSDNLMPAVNTENIISTEQQIHQNILNGVQNVQNDAFCLMQINKQKFESLKNLMEATNIEHKKEIGILNEKNEELTDQLKLIILDRNKIMLQEQQKIIVIKEENANEIKALKEKQKQETLKYLEEIEDLKNEHRIKINEMERQIQETLNNKSDFESQLERKYLNVTNQMRKDADKQIEEKMKCKGCGRSFEIDYCSSLCQQLW